MKVPVAAVDAAIADYCDVAYYVFAHPTDFPWGRTLEHLAATANARTFPPLELLLKVVGHAIFALRWNAKYRELTADEQAVHAAAWRLYRALDHVEL